MFREVIAYQIPSDIKLSEAVQIFEPFGDITKVAFDEIKRSRRPFANLFICYADQIGASRAVNAGSVVIRGHRVRIERSRTSLNFGLHAVEARANNNALIGQVRPRQRRQNGFSQQRMARNHERISYP